MTPDRLEEIVVEFLERSGADPALSAEEFAAAHGDDAARVLAAIRAAIEVESMFPADGVLPQSIGPYRVHGELGRGGMGIVYRAEREGRNYAVKLLPLAPIVGPRVLERFRREAATLAQLSHPHIVKVHDTGMHDEMPYLAMDWIEGRPLQEVAPAMSREEATRLMETLAATLEAAHRQGILHRDLKPQNILVRPDGTPVVLDFGLSAADEFPTLTATGEVVGTPRYMAPEQLLEKPVDARSDVYALGLILFELLSRRPARTEKTRDSLLDVVRRGRVPRLRTVDPGIPRELEKVVRMALARDPARRYASAGALADDLARFHRGEPVRARPPGRWIAAREWVREHPAQAWTAAAALFGILALAGAWLGNHAAEGGRERAGPHIDLAVAKWIDGDSLGARRELAQARRLDPNEATARLLASHWSGRREPAGATPCLRAAREALVLCEARSYAEASAKLGRCESGDLRPAFVAAVTGLGASEKGDPQVALEELSNAARLLPTSVRVQRGIARASDRLQRYPDAVRALRRATELAPDSAAIWAELAEVQFHQRDLPSGLRSIATAESLTAIEVPRILRLRGILEIHAGHQEEGRRRLTRVLELNPNDIQARYQMAYSFDLDHRLIEAERAYHSVLDLDSNRVDALVCLANLYSGASRGQCHGCDSAYAAHPGYLDPVRAERYALRTLRTDRGETEWVVSSTRDIALRLKRRGPVIELLERLTAGPQRTPAVLRLEEMLRRLRLVEG